MAILTNNCINNQGDSLTAVTNGLTVTLGATTLTPLAGTNGGVVVSSTSGVITHIENPSTDGQLLIAAADGTNPVWASITSSDSSITVTPGTHTLSLTVTSPSGLVWAEVNDATKTLAVSHGYLTTRATTPVVFLLPATAIVGQIVAVVGSTGTGGWSITQGTDQYIKFGSSVGTTASTGGSISSTNQYDTIELICNVTNLGWVVRNAVGNLTIV